LSYSSCLNLLLLLPVTSIFPFCHSFNNAF
jgi:hypothetical protein